MDEYRGASRVAPWGSTFWDQPTEQPAMTSCELVQSIDERRQPERLEGKANPPRQPELGQERYAPTIIACDRCAIVEDDPPTLAPSFLGHRRE